MNSIFYRANLLTRQRFGNVINLFAPLYLSNECTDICDYCGFSFANRIERKTLSVPEVMREALFLKEEGFAHLLLVAGEAPKAVSPDSLAEILKALRPHFSSLGIEVAPFETETYQFLKGEGLDRVVIYQETYDRSRYADVHRGGAKRNFDRRFEAPERAARAGIRQVGMGILLGLSDWRRDAEALVAHVKALKKKYWQTEFTVSFPRLRPCASDYIPPFPVSDEEYKELIATTRLLLPDTGIYLSTRETPSFRDELIEVGVTHMSAGSKTNPGGYTLESREDLALPVRAAGGTGGKSAQRPPVPTESREDLALPTEQFEIADHRSPKEVAAALARKGMEPVWKDWQRGLS